MLLLSVAVLTICSVSAVVYNPKPLPPKLPIVPKIGYCNRNWRPVPCPRIALIHQCDSNRQCRPWEKCCKDDCGNRVCRRNDIVSPVVRSCRNERPGRRCLASFNRPHQCDSNSDCGRKRVCCRDRCNVRVCRRQSVVIPKVPKCPVGGPFGLCLPGRQIHKCDDNSDCGKRSYCCRNSCNVRVCRRRGINPPNPRLPVCRSSIRGPIACPLILRPHNECNRDRDCGLKERCCRDRCGSQKCERKPSSIIPKCPRSRLGPFDRLCRPGPNSCHDNSECRRNEICCRNSCGRNVCRTRGIINPLPKPGQCPVSRRPCTSVLRNRCQDDHDCRGKQKCCRVCGNRTCLNPVFRDRKYPL